MIRRSFFVLPALKLSFAFILAVTIPSTLSFSLHNRVRSLVPSSALSLLLSNSSPPPSNDDLNRWQNMYNSKSESDPKNIFADPRSGDGGLSSTSSLPLSCEVRVVTFDLDNTLWKTDKVISEANEVLNDYLKLKFDNNNDNGIISRDRVEVVMGRIFNSNKDKYSPSKENVDNDKNVGGPVFLTSLRKDAILELVKRSFAVEESTGTRKDIETVDNDGEDIVSSLSPSSLSSLKYDEEKATILVNKAFQKWTDARHNAIANNLASNVVECLSRIKSIKTSDGNSIIVGAITDGNSDPRKVDFLAPFFDFCINAEDVGISKPNRKIYRRAALFASNMVELQPVFMGNQYHSSNEDDNSYGEFDLNDDAIDDVIGQWWVHVGDDFIKDVVASAQMGMRSIWCRELIKDRKESKSTSSKVETSSKPKLVAESILDSSVKLIEVKPNSEVDGNNSNRVALESNRKKQSENDQYSKKKSVDDLAKEIANSGAGGLEMSIGSDTFLIDSIQEEFAEAIVESFSDVADVIEKWHEESLGTKKGLPSIPLGKVNVVNDDERMTKINVAEEEITISSNDSDPVNNVVREEVGLGKGEVKKPSATTSNIVGRRFCIFCGEGLPSVAKFCPTCGKNQQDL